MAYQPRPINTLIGNGWLRESPRNFIPRGWDVRSRSSLRKCMFLPAMPRDFLDGLPPPPPSRYPVVPFQPPKPQPKREVDVAPRRIDPKFHARMFPAHGSAAREVRDALGGRGVVPALQPSVAAMPLSPAPHRSLASSPAAWWEEPVTLGTLLLFVPPIGLAALWSSRRYTNDARWALTVMTALTMILFATVAVALLTLRVA